MEFINSAGFLDLVALIVVSLFAKDAIDAVGVFLIDALFRK